MRSWVTKATLAGIIASTFLFILLAAGEGGASGQGQRVRWSAVDDKLNSKGQSLTLGDGAQSFVLRDGWSCTVGATKPRVSYEARTTVCQKGAEAFQFNVQCERSRPKDRTQIGFLTADRKFGDFIEVSCEVL